jgi:cytochrome c551/c552
MGLKKLLLFVIILVIVPAGIFDSTFGDDERDNEKHRTRYRERHRDDHRRTSDLTPVTNPTYKDSCGACHFAYQPGLLPSASWKRIVEGLADHFGESFELDQVTKNAISSYLGPNASEHSNSKVAVKIMKSLRGQVPMRITGIPYIKEKHHRIPAATLKRDSIGSTSNCVACHRRAEDGIYDDDYVAIPD